MGLCRRVFFHFLFSLNAQEYHRNPKSSSFSINTNIVTTVPTLAGTREESAHWPASGGLSPGAEESFVQHIWGQESRCLFGESIDPEKMRFMKKKYK